MGRQPKETKEESSSDFLSSLSEILESNDLVHSSEEAEGIAASILDDLGRQGEACKSQLCIDILMDFFSVTKEEVTGMILPLFPDLEEQNAAANDEDQNESWFDGVGDSNDDDDDDDKSFIGEGECELCERQIKLTRHHLIPRSTWPRFFPVFMAAREALKRKDMTRALNILGPGMMHFKEPLTLAVNKADVKQILQTTTDICRPCHSTIHRSHDNVTLAREYNTVELLLRDPSIYKFCKWASRQKAGKYATR